MNKQEIKNIIDKCHEDGKKVAVSFCSHVPQEILEAAGIVSLRLPYVNDADDAASAILIRNVCPIVKNVCNICEDEALVDADLIFAETSCDGKKKMYELLSNQDKLYFYQVGQGADRDYVRPLIKSEAKFLIREMKKRFDIDVTDEAIFAAGDLVNKERESIVDLMAIQKSIPVAAWGSDIYKAIEENRMLPDIKERIAANVSAREALLAQDSPVKKSAKRIIVTGCPLNCSYEKVISAVENNGGVVVAFENCEILKSAVRRFNSKASNVYESLADCYQNTACALMAPNTLRFELVKKLVDEYKVDGILDVTLQTCHPYTVEKYKMGRYCENELFIPYMSIETDDGDSDVGQLATRIAAFVEML